MKRPFPQSSRLNSQKHYARSASEAKHSWLWRGLVYAHIPDNGSRSFKDISGNNLHAFVSSTNNLFSLKNVKEYTAIEKDSSDGSTTFSIPLGRANKYHCGDFTKIINFYLENNVKSGPTGRSIYFTMNSTVGPGYYSVTIDNDYIDVSMYDNIFTFNLAYNTNSTILWKERAFNSIVITRKKELLEVYVNNIKYPLTNNSIGDYGSILIEPRTTLQLIQNAPVRNTMAVVSNRLYSRYFLPEEIAQDYAAGPCGFAIRKPRTIPVRSATVVTPPTSQSTLIIPKKHRKLVPYRPIARSGFEAQYPQLWRGLEYAVQPCLEPIGSYNFKDYSPNNFKQVMGTDGTGYGLANWSIENGYRCWGPILSNAWVSTPHTAKLNKLNLATDYTISVWCIGRPAYSTGLTFEFAKSDLVETNYNWGLTNLNNSSTWATNSGQNPFLFTGTTTSKNTRIWNNICLVCKGNERSMYHNGRLISYGTFTLTGTIPSGLGIHLGTNTAGSIHSALIGDARFYSRPFDEQDIKLNYAVGPGGFTILKQLLAIQVSGVPEPPPTGIQTASFTDGAIVGDSYSIQQTISRTVTDGAKAGDTLSVMQVISRSFNEGVKVGETWQTISAISKTISEGIKAGESWAFSLVRLANVTEGSVAGDSFTTLQTISRSLNEGVTVTDVLSAVALVNSGLVEGAKASDSFTTNTIKLATILEGAKAGDTFSTLQNMYMTFAEGAKIGDGWLAERLDQFSASFTDGIKAGDAFSALSAIQKSFSEAVVVGESFSVLQTIIKLVAEGIKAGDAITPQVTYHKAFTEGILAGDAFAGSFVTGLSLSDGASVGDSWTIQQVISRTLLEGIRAGDTISGIMGDYEIVYTAIKTYAAVLFNSLRIEPSVRFSRIRTDEV